MAVKFNPFSGQLQIDEKGASASYIDGEVATYNDLPLDGTAALDSAWLVRSASGVWPVSRKQAGIYIRTATAGSSRDADYTYAGTMPDVFSDAVFTLYDEASTTRTGQFNLGSITAGQNRVLTWPDGNGTIARTSDIPSTFAASAITSGVFDNARINFAAPSSIGSTTANSGAFTTLSANNGTLTASAPVLDLSQTWNASGTTFTALRLNVTNTASNSASNLLDIQVGGTTRMMLKRDGVLHLGQFTNSGFYSPAPTWHGSTAGLLAATNLAIGSSLDTILERGGAGILEQRNLANAQTYRIYNTYTDASNYERAKIAWSSNVLQIGTEKGGTGSARALEFQTDGATRFTLAAANTATFAGGLALQWGGGGTRIIGATFPSNLLQLQTASTDRLVINDTLVAFGSATNAFPALKRSSTTLQVRLADDSAYSVLDAQLRAQGTAPATSGAAGTAGDIRYDADYIYVCTAANTWKRAAIATW